MNASSLADARLSAPAAGPDFAVRGRGSALWLALVAVSTLLLGGGLATWSAFQAAGDVRARVGQTQEVLAGLRELLSAMVEAETGQRGYLVTLDEAFLEPYEDGNRRIPGLLAQLQAAPKGTTTARQEAKLADLSRLVEEKLAHLAETVTLAKSGRLENAVAIVRTGEGRRIMDGARALIADLESEEARDLAAALSQAETTEDRTLASLIALGFGALALVAVAFWLARRSFDLEDATREAALAQAGRDALARTFEEMQAAVWVLDAGGFVQIANKEAGRLAGRPPEELIGRRLRAAAPWDEKTAELLERAWNAARGGTIQRLETAFDGGGRRCVSDVGLAPLAGGEVVVTAFDVTARDEAEERARLTMGEINHRVKNLFALVPAIVSLSARTASDVQTLQQAVRERVGALARAHALTLGEFSEQRGVNLRALIDSVLEPYRGEGGALRLGGPDMRVPSRIGNTLGLTLHELATNAVKYGALSSPNGTVEVRWSEETGDGGAPLLALSWRERDGPPVSGEPERRGFGTTLIDRLVAAQQGRMERAWDREGVRTEIALPLDDAAPQAGAAV